MMRSGFDRQWMCVLVLLATPAFAAEPAKGDWTTFRGNAQRTACTDGVAGPEKPRVLWALKSQEHFIAAPVPAGDRLFVSSLGGFNVSRFHCLSTDPAAKERTLYLKSTPYLKLPTVSSPAVAGDLLFFGDGMHQTNGAFLHCFDLKSGLPVWQLPVPGELVHLEGTPTIAGNRLYMGGGAAGVLCVQIDKVTLEGKEMPLEAARKLIDSKWKELQDKYAADKKKDPEFAVPPNEDMLPKPLPAVLWQQGKEKWHVDAPLAVAGDKVLVASAFLDKEKVGDRALFCLDAGTGKIEWRAPLKLNPWGGPTVAGDVAVISGSTIGYDPNVLKGAKGEITAINVADGKEKWNKPVAGGVLACVAVADDKVVACASDGKVRAYNLKDGSLGWFYDADKTPIFAAPAVAGNTVYAADLRGVVHAIDLKAGAGKWKLDLGADPAVKAGGMVYGGPVVHAGRIYLATCNLTEANKPTAVVCIGN